jgi:hypothetical protein
MKKVGTILGILLLIALTVTGCHFIRNRKEALISHGRDASRHMQNSRPNSPMFNMPGGNNKRMQPGMGQGMRRGMGPGMQGGMRRGMGPGMQGGMRRGMGPGMQQGVRRGSGPGMNGNIGNGAGNGMGAGRGNGMMRGMQQGPANNNRNGNGPLPANSALSDPIGSGGIFIDNIPNVTEKQKKEFADLKQKQQEEMTKMRSDMAAKIKSTIEAQRSKMLNLFTKEQKKYIGPESVNKR